MWVAGFLLACPRLMCLSKHWHLAGEFCCISGPFLDWGSFPGCLRSQSLPWGTVGARAV